MKNRFLVFKFSDYGNGGWDDFEKAFPSKDVALRFAKVTLGAYDDRSTYQVVDIKTLSVVFEGKIRHKKDPKAKPVIIGPAGDYNTAGSLTRAIFRNAPISEIVASDFFKNGCDFGMFKPGIK